MDNLELEEINLFKTNKNNDTLEELMDYNDSFDLKEINLSNNFNIISEITPSDIEDTNSVINLKSLI